MKDLARTVPFEFTTHERGKVPRVSHNSAPQQQNTFNEQRGFTFYPKRLPKRNPICYGSPKKRSCRFQLDRNPFGTFEAYNRTWTQQQYKFSRSPSGSSDMVSSKDTDDQSVSTAASFSTAQSSFSDTNDAHSSVDSLISRLDNISLDSERILKEHNEENSRRRPKNDAYVAFTKNYIGLRRKAQNILDTYLDRGLDFDEAYEKTAIPKPVAVKPLTDEEEKIVRDVMRKGQTGEIARLKTAIVEYKDIYKLYPETWLNDEIINFYMELISHRANDENSGLPSVHCFNTFFCSTLREHGYAKVRRWTKRVDIFAKDLILIPINYSYHWTLGVIDMRNKTIQIYDSLHGNHDSTLRLLLSYLEDEHMDKKKQPIDLSDWRINAPKDIPRQGNMSDCGVFTCTFAERLSRQQPFDFSQRDMELIRQRMVLSIIYKSIQ